MNEDVKPTKKLNFIIPLIGIGLLCFAVGYLTGAMLFPLQTEPLLDKDKIIQQSKEEIRKEVISELIPETINYLSEAIVKEVGENYLVAAPSPEQNPSNLIFPEEVKINIDKNTSIQQMTSDESSKKLFDTNPATLNDIKPDDFLWLVSSNDNIKGLKEFTATTIVFETKK